MYSNSGCKRRRAEGEGRISEAIRVLGLELHDEGYVLEVDSEDSWLLTLDLIRRSS